MLINKKPFNLIVKCKTINIILFSVFFFVARAQDNRWTIAPHVGIATNDFNWSIAGTEAGTDPNVLSELIWKDLRAVSYNLQTDYRISNRFRLSLSGSYDQIVSGYGNDSDYATNNRTGNFYNLDFNSDIGYGYDVALTVSYQLPRIWKLRPRVLMGYNQMGQRLYLLGMPDDLTATDLRSTYQTSWFGAHGGLELSYQISRFNIGLMYKLGLYDYQAKANWNLIETFEQPVSFRQYAFAATHDVNLEIVYTLNKQFGLVLTGEHTTGYTLPGLDVAYRADGTQPRTRLNGANYTRFAGTTGLRYSF